MRILYIRLNNVKNIESGQGVRNFEVDLSKQKNPVCIISGPNGSGKTSLLSYLTPFASLGNLDIRDSGSIIINGENGEKEIRIQDEEDIYIIRHLYTPKKNGGHTVKSYIECNGVELNENGNVTSFKELVYEKLGLNMDYLKLIRIGDNVSNLIDAKSTERKTYMGKILDIVDIYLKQHKQLGMKLRDIKTIINHMMDELQKTGVRNPEETKEKIQEMKDNIRLEETFRLNYEKELAKKTAERDAIGFGEDGKFKLRSLEKKVEKFTKVLNALPEGQKSADIYKEKVESTKEKLLETETRLSVERENYTSLLNDIDSSMEHIKDIELEIRKENTKINQSSTKNMIDTLVETVQHLERAEFHKMSVNCTKEEFESLMVFYKSIQQKLQNLYEYGQAVVSESVRLIQKRVDIKKFSSQQIAEIEKEENEQRAMILDKLISQYKEVSVDCKLDCPLKALHKDLLSYDKSYVMKTPKRPKEFYIHMQMISESLKYIMDELLSVNDTLEKLPIKLQEELTINKILKRIQSTDLIYPEKLMNDYLSKITEYTLWQDKNAQLHDLQIQFDQMQSMSKVPFYEKELEREKEKKKELDQRQSDTMAKFKTLQDEITRLEAQINSYQTTYDALTEMESIQAEIVTLKDAQEKSEKLTSEISELTNQLQRKVSFLQMERPKLTLTENALDRYHTLLHELDEKQKERDEINLIMYALSNREGIPLYHIQNYLNGTRKLANQLLDIVYDGRIQLGKFEITEDVFAMPYIKDGKEIEDVSLASQGEKSFFNMAISSALRAQGLTKYNIALYDEPDGPFDDNNRQKFIPVLEKQLEVNQIEQAFLITHNLMFAKYPVDLIDLGNLENSTVDILTY